MYKKVGQVQARAVPFGAASVDDGTLAAVRSRNERGEPAVRNVLPAGVLAALVDLAGCGVGNGAIDLPPVGSGNGGPPDSIA